MKTTYLIWKNPSCNGIDPDWQEINGREFLALVRSPEGKCRRFVKLASTEADGEDGAIVMEATEADYLDWKREKNRSDYLRNGGKAIKFVSYHALESGDGECFGEELLPDPGSDVENQLVKTLALEAALASLTEEEYRLVEFLYLSDTQGTLRDYEALTGISRSTACRRHKAILDKLKSFFAG